MFLGGSLPGELAFKGWDLRLPPACTVALEFPHGREYDRPWLERLGQLVTDLRLSDRLTVDVAFSRKNYIHAPELSQLRHVPLFVPRGQSGSLCLARLLGGLPLDFPSLMSEEAVIMVPASLRALRIKAVCDNLACRPKCDCRYSGEDWSRDGLTFGLHAGLERLCLVLWGARVGLQCLDAGALAGLRELDVQALVLHMDTHVAAKVAQQGSVESFNMYDNQKWYPVARHLHNVPIVKVAHIGQGSVHVEDRRARGSDWACACGTCPECLGPEVFGGIVDAPYC